MKRFAQGRFFIAMALLVLGVVPSSPVFPVQARIRQAIDSCRIAPAPALDAMGAFVTSLDHADMRAFNIGDSSCLSELMAGAALSQTLQWLHQEHVSHPGTRLLIHSVVASAEPLAASDAEANAATTLNGTDCATLHVTVYRAMSFQHQGSPTTTSRATIVEQYTLRDTGFTLTSAVQPARYVALSYHPLTLTPLPTGVSGSFAPDLTNAVDRYITTLPVTLSLISPSQMQALARTGFVISGAAEGQKNFFGVIGNEEYDPYSDNIRSSIPSFVTLDAGLHTFHVLFDRSLLTAESVSLRPRLAALLADLLRATTAQRHILTSPAMLDANGRNAVYLAVPLLLLGGTVPPGALTNTQVGTVEREVALVETHAAQATSPFLGITFDYQLFTPRGHYTAGPDLARYFAAMNWLALIQAPLEPARGIPPSSVRVGARRAVLMAALMSGASGRRRLAEWHSLADPISALIGAAAGPTLSDVLALTARIYGTGDLSSATPQLQDPGRLSRFIAAVHTLPAVPYRSTSSTGASNVRGFGLFPARTIPDGVLAAALTYPNVGSDARPRTLPSGLDVMAALGSTRAAQLAEQAGPWPQYPRALTRARLVFQHALRAPTIYAHWLSALQPLARPMPAGAPRVMQTAAWADKELMTGLASWSELRHDSILYASQFGGGGGGGMCQAPPRFRPGYVEPVPAAWRGLATLGDRLAQVTRTFSLLAGLPATQQAPLLAAEDAYRHGLHTLADIAAAEVAHRPIGSADALLAHDAFPILGAPMETFFTKTPHPLTDPTSTQAAEIADVATDLRNGQVLEVGEGQVRPIWVLVPADGFTWLMRGEVYTYYEFTSAQRLSDQQWQQNFTYGNTASVQEPAWIEAITR